MIKLIGDVCSISDERRDFPVKDKDGNKTDVMKSHRIVQIVLLCKDGGTANPVVIRAFDPPASFVPPKVGDKAWTTPEITEYKSKFRAVPEASIF